MILPAGPRDAPPASSHRSTVHGEPGYRHRSGSVATTQYPRWATVHAAHDRGRGMVADERARESRSDRRQSHPVCQGRVSGYHQRAPTVADVCPRLQPASGLADAAQCLVAMDHADGHGGPRGNQRLASAHMEQHCTSFQRRCYPRLQPWAMVLAFRSVQLRPDPARDVGPGPRVAGLSAHLPSPSGGGARRPCHSLG